MDFAEILKRVDRVLYDASDKTALSKLGRFMERSGGMEGLLKTNNPILNAFPAANLLGLAQVFENYNEWRDAYRKTKRALATSKLTLPDQSLQSASYPHELSALVRTAQMCRRSGYADLESWTHAVNAHLSLWNNALSVAMAEGTASATLTTLDNVDNPIFEGYLFTKETLQEIKSHKWLGARRGEQAGIVTIAFHIPAEEIINQVTAYLPQLGTAAKQRTPESIADELILDNLTPTVRSLLDRNAKEACIRTAQEAYRSLLSAPVPDAKSIVGISVNDTDMPVGIVSTDHKGKLQEQQEIPKTEEMTQKITSFVKRVNPDLIVLPVTTSDKDSLDQIEASMASLDMEVARALSSATKDACKRFQSPVPIATALILAMRVMRPTKEWGKVPPSKIGLGEFSGELDNDLLDRSLETVRLLVILDQQRNQGHRGVAPPARKMKRLNPMVRTIMDLKPGMNIDGVITNLTKFGAFVNVGLTTEAMIHVSQLSTDFIDQPSQVVRVGQTVSARILEVIPERGRIALSLKPADADNPRRTASESKELQTANMAASKLFRPPSLETNIDRDRQTDATKRTSSSDKNSHHPQKSRHEALADLDALFKK